MGEHPTLLEVKQLKKYFPIRRGFFQRTVGHVKAVDKVSFTLKKGETLGLVGESGCGKTTLARTTLRLLEPTDGEILYHRDVGPINLMELNKRQMKSVRRDIQVIFQDPHSSLNPRMSVADIISDPLLVYGINNKRKRDARVKELLELVGLRVEATSRYPHEFSGGQRQRIGIARALALEPKLIICDEAVSALDVSVQAQILNLLKKLQNDFGLTYLFVSHDLSVIGHVSDRIAVMYLGQIVEMADADELYRKPKHPYSEALLSAIPKPDPDAADSEIILEGDVPSPSNPPTGCYFHPRCRYSDGNRCVKEAPLLQEISPRHFSACHFAKELPLRGVFDEHDNGTYVSPSTSES